MSNEKIDLVGVFKSKISYNKFKEYIKFYNLEEEEEEIKEELKKRNYKIMGDRKIKNSRLNLEDIRNLNL
jgi:hypothetical protein